MSVAKDVTTRAPLALLATFVVTFFQLGSMKAFGVLVPELSEHLSMSMLQIGLSGGIWFTVRALLGPLWSTLARLISYRYITILGGLVSSMGILCAGLSVSWLQLNMGMILLGVGHGLPIVAKVIVLKDYFKDNFAMATGVAFSGGALGMIVFAPVMEMGIATYGWRGTMFLFGALNLNMCVAGALMIPPVTAKSNTQSKINKNIFETDKEDKPCIGFLSTISDYLGVDVLLESPITAIYFAAFSLHAITLIGWITFLVSYTISIGYSNQTASYLSALAGVGALFGRIMYAPLVDGGVISGRVMFCLLAIGGALSVASYPFTDQYWVLSIISVLTGVFLSSAPPVYIIVLHELFPDDQGTFSSAVGLHYMARGLGRLVGGPLTGMLYDWSEDFYTAFLVLAAIEAVVALLVFIMVILSSRIKKT